MRVLRRVREEAGQASWLLRRFRTTKRFSELVEVRRCWVLPDMSPSRGAKIWAVALVRDELDVLPSVIDHLFEQGIEAVLIADNRSIDGTREYIRDLAANDPRVHLVEDEIERHTQAAKVTTLAYHARRHGAQWILPIDADEFWFARDQSVADFLRGLPDEVTIVDADFHHMVPLEAHPKDLRSSEFMLDSTPSFPGKVAVRPHPLLEVWPGNHSATRVGRRGKGLFIAHAIYRGPGQIARKVRQGFASAQRTGEDLSWFSPHWQAGASLSDEEIADVFEKISHGLPDPRIMYEASGPMITVSPLQWGHWGEDGTL